MKYYLSEILYLKTANLYLSVRTSIGEVACFTRSKYDVYYFVQPQRGKTELTFCCLHRKYYKAYRKRQSEYEAKIVGKMY